MGHTLLWRDGEDVKRYTTTSTMPCCKDTLERNSYSRVESDTEKSKYSQVGHTLLQRGRDTAKS